MRSAQRALWAVLIALSALLLASSPAVADPSGRISSVSVDEGEVSLTFTGVDLPAGTLVDPASVQVTFDGRPLDATATPVTEAVEPPLRTVVLALDTSGSMADDGKLDGAKQAALSFLEAVPSEVLVGLVSFSQTPALAVEPTVDRAAVTAAIESLVPEGDTALYDAVVLSVNATGSEGIRSVILLSDGADTISSADLPTAVETASASGAQVDAIALGEGGEEALSALTQITASTGGSVVQAADAGDLAEIFQVAAETFTNELSVAATIPADVAASSGTIEVTATAGETALSASAFVTVAPGQAASARPAAPAQFGPVAVTPPEPRLSESVASWIFPVGLALVGIGAAAILALAFLAITRDRSGGIQGRLSLYTLGGRRPRKTEEVTTTILGGSAVAKSAVELADRVVKERRYEDDLAQRLDAAGLPFRSAEWVLIQGALALGLGLLVLLLTGFAIIPAVLALGVGIALPYLYLSAKASQRRGKFVSQLPDTLQLMAGSMEAGYSLPQSVDTVVREDLDPVSTEFNRALAESRLGVPIEDSLESIAQRMQSRDFDWVVMAIRIQRQVGGSLAEIMKTVATTLREREQLRRTIRALSADGRLSAWIVGLAPFVVTLFLVLFRPGYINPLFESVIGLVMIGVALFLIAVGVFIITRIIKGVTL